MRILTTSFAAIALAACGLASTHAAPPNLVVFISDDHGYLDSEVAGATGVRTPNMLRLAEAGMTFTHAFAASPSCAPSRAALLTGLMPMRNGSMLNHQPPRAGVKKLPAYLQELGYEVVAFGKVAHYKQAKDYGFDHASHDTFHDHEGIPAALKFLRERKSSKPLCLLVGTNWPHVPWPREGEAHAEPGAKINLPPTHIDTPETHHWRRRYYAAIEKMDADLGQIYDAAYKYLGDNTLFIHFSDHGAQWPFGKWNLYDAGIRVPFFAIWPGVVEPKSKTDAMISLVDVLPTLIEAGGGKPPQGRPVPLGPHEPGPTNRMDGRSQLSVLKGERVFARSVIFTTHSGDGNLNAYPIRSVRTRWEKYVRNLKPEAQHHTHIDLGKAIDGNEYWKSWVAAAETADEASAIVNRYFKRPGEEYYYDLDRDPHELRNLAGHAGLSGGRNRLSKMLDRWMLEQGDEGLATEKSIAESFKPE